MPNGKPGDHPYTDLAMGIYIFPPPIDSLMKEAHELYPDLADRIGKGKLLAWQSPDRIEEARNFLEKLIAKRK